MPDPLSWKRLFWLALLLITFLALMPWSQELPGPFRWSDKLNHFAAFVVLSWLLVAAYLPGWVRSWGLLVAYGAGIEGIQYFLPWRSAEWADLGVDALAAMTGLTLYPLFVRIVNRTLSIIASYKIDNKGR